MSKSYQSIRGTYDFSPDETLVFNRVISQAREVFQTFAFEEISLPLLEEIDLFIRGVGEGTDIVEKQMFKIQDKEIALRPEGTAQVVRFYLQNSLHKQSDFHKFSYIGPMFRGERPQKGRLRQFHHLGAEAIGSDSILIEAEVISAALKILDSVGISEKELKINSLGCLEDKQRFSKELHLGLNQHQSRLCPDCKRRIDKNPLRVIDCKVSQCREIVTSLKLGESSLCGDCKERFQALLSLLDSLNIAYSHDPFMVRGLDYYTHTVFEISSASLGSQDAIGAGGRYNNLVKDLGGPDIPAVGFALGLERILLALKDSTKADQAIDLFVAVIGDENLKQTAASILKQVRFAGIKADTDYCNRSLKGQLRYAQKKNIRYVAILGEDEFKENSVMLKNMADSKQEKVKVDELIDKIKKG